MRILLMDTTQYRPASPLFLEALEELATGDRRRFVFVDEFAYLQGVSRSVVQKLAYRLLGRRPLTYWRLNADIRKAARRFRPELVLVVKGAHVSPETVHAVKQETGAVVVNYATDDPFNPRANTRDLVRGIRFYDVYACTKRAIMQDVKRAGAGRVVWVPFAYKPSVHFPEVPTTAEEWRRFGADVVLVGGCDADRIPYFEALIEALPNIRVHLYGNYWNRHARLRAHWRGFCYGRDYRLALGGARIAINLVRRSNRDGHVMRTFEVPACGAFMLAERTDEHLELFDENEHAAFFGSPEELVDKVEYFLRRDEERQRIAQGGFRRVTLGRHTYKDRLLQILTVIE